MVYEWKTEKSDNSACKIYSYSTGKLIDRGPIKNKMVEMISHMLDDYNNGNTISKAHMGYMIYAYCDDEGNWYYAYYSTGINSMEKNWLLDKAKDGVLSGA